MTIIQSDILKWCEEYDGEPFHALLCDPPYHLAEIVKRFGGADSAPAQYGRDGAFQRASHLPTFGPLYLRIGATMARIAQGFEVADFVRLFVAVKAEQAKRLHVVNILTRTAASSAGIVITFQGFAPLGLPVRPALLLSFTIQVLRMVQAMSMLITTWARAVFTTALACFQNTFILPKLFAAVKASKMPNISGSWSYLHRSVLTRWRAVLTASVL
jgi:hypothetical protein